MRRALRFALCLAAAAGVARAQNGDVAGEAQPPLREEWRVPAPRALSPEEELATFAVDEGLRVELVAAEPLVRDPVCASFDERGRLWVCEMSAYMLDLDAHGESEPVGVVAVLSDRDRDGRMDERTVFLDQLVLPRAVAPTRGGALVISPPNLIFARDTDGDGRADDVRVVDNGLQGVASPEHAINGLLPTLDNWFACANAPVRYRFRDGKWERGRTAGGGQWGITEDRFGRIFYDDNSNPLRCDLYPSQLAIRNPNLGVAPGIGVNIAKGARPRPSHPTPGVNRGYREGVLVDGRLNEFTGACAPWIYEGDALPERYRGDAFVCEPCGNLVHRFELAYDTAGVPSATSAPPDGAFLTSTDERFRPVFLNEGPDSALYVVDMYRGLIQHRLFVTSWLREQVEARQLEQPLGRGRIWRVTAKDAARRETPDLASCSWSELAHCLDSDNRWLRKTAQRLFVEEGEGEAAALEVLRLRVRDQADPSSIGRLHAACALVALDRDPAWRATFTPSPSETAWLARREVPLTWLTDPRQTAPWRNLLAFDVVGPREALTTIANAAELGRENEIARGLVLTTVAGRELELLDALHERTRTNSPGMQAMYESLGACIVREGRPERIEKLLGWIVGSDVDRKLQVALARGASGARAKDASGARGPLRITQRTWVFDHVEERHGGNEDVAALFAAAIWPGKPGTEAQWPRALDAAESERFRAGRALFEQGCASCHQLSGLGDPGLAPPLRNSAYVLASPERLAKIVLHGLRGPIAVDGLSWDGEMPAFAASDDEIAAVLTYLRREWNHVSDPVAPELVRAVREQNASRKNAWSAAELEAK